LVDFGDCVTWRVSDTACIETETIKPEQHAEQLRFLFGYDTGYISSVFVTIGTSLGHVLSTSEQELVTSLTSGGALIGAVGAGLTADRFGRKMPIWAACIVFVIGTVLQTAAFSVARFAVGRFVVGLGVGSAAMVMPLYIGELAPAKYRKFCHRDRHLTISNVCHRWTHGGL
jgi:MFS family permease